MATPSSMINKVKNAWNSKMIDSYLPFATSSMPDPKRISWWSDPGRSPKLNTFATLALLYMKNKGVDITGTTQDYRLGIGEIGKENYIAEYVDETGNTTVFKGTSKGIIWGIQIDSAGIKKSIEIDDNKTEVNLIPLYALYFTLIQNSNIISNADGAGALEKKNEEEMKTDFGKILSATNLSDVADELFRLNDSVYQGFKAGKIPCKLQGSSFPMLDLGPLQNLPINVLYGHLSIGKTTENRAAQTVTLQEAQKMFKDKLGERKWTKEEKKRIPEFPDNYPGLTESIQIARLIVESSTWTKPIRTIYWRGGTGIGKSTGAKFVAAALGIPYYSITCDSKTDMETFRCQYVPDNNGAKNSKSGTIIMPEMDLMSIRMDPEGYIKRLTGDDIPNATSEDAFQIYTERVIKAVSAQKQHPDDGTPRYKMVESPYVTALANGYILEIQEPSRIKDRGILVGLNEYDHTNAVIELPDGTQRYRHRNAIVIYTDNVGYSSCKPLDQSVLRRMDIVIDSRDLSDEEMLKRVKYNTGYTDDDMLKNMLGVMKDLCKYCKEHDLREADISVNELERWVQLTQLNLGLGYIDTCKMAMISKVSSDYEVQDEVLTYLSTTSFTQF